MMRGHSSAVAWIVSALLLLAWGAPLEAQDDTTSEDEEQTYEQLQEERMQLTREVTRATPAQLALARFHLGLRDLDRATDLAAKAEGTTKAAKADKIYGNSMAAYQSATENFLTALRLQPEMVAAYEPLGLAFRRLGNYEASLEVHATALTHDPESTANFQGWAESLLALDMLGDATATYDQYAETDPERAAVLLEEMKKWLAVKQADPGDLDPADVEKLADWIEQREDN